MRRWLFFAGKAAVSGLLIWWLVDRIDLVPIAAAAARMSAGPIVLAFAVALLGVVVLVLRWMVISRVLDTPLAPRRAAWLVLVGLFFGQTLPSMIGGDVVRVWFLRRDGVPFDRAAISVILDRFCALAVSVMIVGASLPLMFSLISDPTARWSMPALVGLGVAGFGFLLLLGGPLGMPLGRWRMLRPFVALGEAVWRLARSGGPLAIALVLAAAINVCTIVIVWLTGVSIAADLSLLHCLVLVPPVVFVSMVPISIAGWGVREGAMVVAFGFVGVPAADALVVSLTFGVLMVATGVPGGILWLLSGQRVAAGGRIPVSMEQRET